MGRTLRVTNFRRIRSYILATICAMAVNTVPALALYKPLPWEQEALDYIISDDKSIVEAMWFKAGTLWVSMLDDGTRHDGYADVVCMQATDKKPPKGTIITVYVFDAYTMARGKLKEIGFAMCQDNIKLSRP